MRKIRALALLACVLAAACGGPAARAPAVASSPAPESPLAKLAAAMEPKEWQPLEPQMPLELRVTLPPKEQPLSSAELLRRARDAAPPPEAPRDQYAKTVTRSLVAIALAERAASGDGADAIEASAFLVERLRALALLQNVTAMLRTSMVSLETAEAQKVAGAMRGYEVLAPQLTTHLELHAARVLRAGAPKDAVVSVLWRLLRDANEAKDADALIAEYRRLKPGLDAEELTRIAELHAQSGARAAFDADVAAARAAIEKTDAPRPLSARLTLAEQKRGWSERLATLRGDDVEGRVERFDLLERLGRTKEADPELDAAERAAPGDGRVRARLAHRAFRRSFMTKGIIEGAKEGYAVLKAVPITTPSVDDCRVDLGFSGMEVATATAKLTGSASPSDFVAAMAPIDASLERFKRVDADSAAGVAHAAERVRYLLSLSEAERDEKMDDVLRDGAKQVIALRKRLPASVDLMRVALVYAAKHPDSAVGLALALDDTGYGSPPRDVDVALDRVGTALSLMAYTTDVTELPALRRALDAVPPHVDQEREGLRFALIADAAMLAALANKGTSWAEVARLYEQAEPALVSQRARLRNNRAYALRRAGQDALTLWDAAAEGGAAGEPHVIAWLNVSLARGNVADLRPRAEEGAEKALSAGATEAAYILYRWLAENAPDAKQAKSWAQRAIAADSRPHTDLAASWPLHCQNDNQLGLGLNSGTMGYVFTARALCRPWLTDAKLARHERLVALAGTKKKR